MQETDLSIDAHLESYVREVARRDFYVREVARRDFFYNRCRIVDEYNNVASQWRISRMAHDESLRRRAFLATCSYCGAHPGEAHSCKNCGAPV